MLSPEVTEKILKAPQDMRERWWVEMNCWGCPIDFPVKLPDFTGREKEQFSDPTWSEAWRTVSQSLSDADQSRAWWLLKLGKTEDEWRQWWSSRRYGDR